MSKRGFGRAGVLMGPFVLHTVNMCRTLKVRHKKEISQVWLKWNLFPFPCVHVAAAAAAERTRVMDPAERIWHVSKKRGPKLLFPLSNCLVRINNTREGCRLRSTRRKALKLDVTYLKK